ncbi:MAG: hypothetical protein E6J77_11010 [Deltaproteobacteria bacterium]|nr:MAG: hypothetical protein E6J77_11010 [Deltaproteobacteria bacterium]
MELQARRLRLDVSTDLHLNASVREADKAMPYASQLGLADGGGYRHLEPCAPLRPVGVFDDRLYGVRRQPARAVDLVGRCTRGAQQAGVDDSRLLLRGR